MTRTELINLIAEKIGAETYMEIGIGSGNNYKAIRVKNKCGVDPAVPLQENIFTMPSDEFFEFVAGLRKPTKHDLIFIDGLHHADQVKRDIINSWECLTDGGCLVIHDTNPDREEITRVPRETKEWTGDVYKTIYQVKNDKITYEGDHGVTIMRKSGPLKITDDEISWEEFDSFRDEVLNLKDWNQTIKTIQSWTKS